MGSSYPIGVLDISPEFSTSTNPGAKMTLVAYQERSLTLSSDPIGLLDIPPEFSTSTNPGVKVALAAYQDRSSQGLSYLVWRGCLISYSPGV